MKKKNNKIKNKKNNVKNNKRLIKNIIFSLLIVISIVGIVLTILYLNNNYNQYEYFIDEDGNKVIAPSYKPDIKPVVGNNEDATPKPKPGEEGYVEPDPFESDVDGAPPEIPEERTGEFDNLPEVDEMDMFEDIDDTKPNILFIFLFGSLSLIGIFSILCLVLTSFNKYSLSVIWKKKIKFIIGIVIGLSILCVSIWYFYYVYFM